MRGPKFDWDENKALANFKKLNVTFDEAALIFEDPNRLTDIDDRFEYGEERLRVIGMSPTRLLTVVCVEVDGDVIRIISARQASKWEEALYFGAEGA